MIQEQFVPREKYTGRYPGQKWRELTTAQPGTSFYAFERLAINAPLSEEGVVEPPLTALSGNVLFLAINRRHFFQVGQ